MVDGKVSFGQIKEPVALIIQAVVGLGGHGEICRMLGIDDPVQASVQAILKERRRNGCSRFCSQVGYQGQFRKSQRRFSNRCVLALPLVGKEGKNLVFLDWSAN